MTKLPPHHLCVQAAPGVRRRDVAFNPWPWIAFAAAFAFLLWGAMSHG